MTRVQGCCRRACLPVLVLLMLFGAGASAFGAPVTTADVAAVNPNSPLQTRYDAARNLESRIALQPGTDCFQSATTALRYLRFVRRSAEWMDHGVDPTMFAIASGMAAAANALQPSLNALDCSTLPEQRPANLPSTQPSPLSIWNGRFTLTAPSGATSAEIHIDGTNVGSVSIANRRMDALAPQLEAGVHLIRVDFFSDNHELVDIQHRQGVVTLPPSAFTPPATRLVRDQELSRSLDALYQSAGGSTAAYILDLVSGAEACTKSATDRFPAASLLKLPVLETALRSDNQLANVYDVATIGGWSSNLAASRLIRLAGEAQVNTTMDSMGALDSSFAGAYNPGTAAPLAPSTCTESGRVISSSTKVTTARDVGAMLRYITIGGTTEASPAGRRILAALIASERAGDNRGIGIDTIDGSTVAAVKNGWLNSDLFHTAAVLFLDSGPRIVVTLTSGLDRTRAEQFATAVFALALRPMIAVGGGGQTT